MGDSATSVLRKEHDAILKMVEAAEEVALQLQGGKQPAAETLAGLLEFFRLFADRCHHGKEEELLFPLLEKRGLPAPGGPIQVMLAEHTEGRSLIQAMSAAAAAYSSRIAGAGQKWAEAALRYATLLRQHILKENEVLFRMADNLLTDADQRELVAAFEQLEEKKMGAGTHERLHQLMDQLHTRIYQCG